MNNVLHPPAIRRILVALDTAEPSTAALEDAARLAAGMEAELVGLFIEDAELLQAAALPMTRIVPHQARTLAAFDPESMQRAYRIWSAEARRSLEAVATRWRIKWSFQVARGTYAEQLLATLRAGDLLALASSKHQRHSRTGMAALTVAAQAPCSLFLMYRRWETWKPVVVLYDGSEEALVMGQTLAAIYNLPLVVLVLAQNEEAAQSEITTVRRTLGGAAHPANLIQVHHVTANRIGDTLRDITPGIVIFDRRGKQTRKIEAALEAVNSSVLSLG
jgi:nucleotide-binding universal stress UspA family protein